MGKEATLIRRSPYIPVAIEAHPPSPEYGEQLLLSTPDDRVISALIHARHYQPFPLTDHAQLLDLRGRVVADPKSVELAMLPFFVHGSARFLERCGPIRRVEVHDVNFVGLECGQRRLHALGDFPGRVAAGDPAGDFCRDNEAGRNGEGAKQRFASARRADRVGTSGVDVGDVMTVKDGENWTSSCCGVELCLGAAGTEGSSAENDQRVSRKASHDG